MKCRNCGHVEENAPDDSRMIRKTQMVEKEITIVDTEEQLHTLPTTAVKCPECGHNLAEWWLRQLRSADESEVRFFRCVKCKYTWREYD